MSEKTANPTSPTLKERTFQRFTLGQRWEHAILLLSSLVLIVTGLPQKYRELSISQDLLSTPDRILFIQQIHHIAAVILGILILYHLGRIIYLMSRRRLPGDLLPTVQDLRDAWDMILYLLFLRKERPKFGRYNFEQKVTYWAVFFGFAAMGISGLIVWFPVQATQFLPGGVIPAAKLVHSTESIVMTIFILIWHIYHVHIERLNLSMFTGRLSEKEMQNYHTKEYERLMAQAGENKK